MTFLRNILGKTRRGGIRNEILEKKLELNMY
jgi:hypothetical protein